MGVSACNRCRVASSFVEEASHEPFDDRLTDRGKDWQQVRAPGSFEEQLEAGEMPGPAPGVGGHEDRGDTADQLLEVLWFGQRVEFGQLTLEEVVGRSFQ